MAFSDYRRRFDTVIHHRYPWRLVTSRLLWRTGLCSFLLVERPGFKIRFFPTSLSASYWADPEDRVEDERLIQMLLSKGSVYVDVGANIGALALCASVAVGEEGRVYAVEPHPRVFRYLEANVALNARDNIKCLNVAVAEHDGEVVITDDGNDDQNRVVRSGDGIAIQCRTVDGLLASENSPIALLKIDVEGYERAVLAGAARVLERCDAVLFEVWDEHLAKYGQRASEIVRLLMQSNFEVFRPNAVSRALIPVSSDYAAPRCENLLALHDVRSTCEKYGWSVSNTDAG
jgi:FkbM family methyltransferase